MKISVAEASIKTASVSVNSLTISGKQVTLAVFRQLVNEPLIDPDTAAFRGLPWGRVHYFWDECKKLAKQGHLHVVWQSGDELRRSCVQRAAHGEPIHYLREIEYLWKSGGYRGQPLDCLQCRDDRDRKWLNGLLADTESGLRRTLNNLSEISDRHLPGELSAAVALAFVFEVHSDAYRAAAAFEDEYNNRYAELLALDQLFIAV